MQPIGLCCLASSGHEPHQLLQYLHSTLLLQLAEGAPSATEGSAPGCPRQMLLLLLLPLLLLVSLLEMPHPLPGVSAAAIVFVLALAAKLNRWAWSKWSLWLSASKHSRKARLNSSRNQ
jgi:hypothetical protein